MNDFSVSHMSSDVPVFVTEDDVTIWVASHQHGLGSYMLDLLLSEAQLDSRSAAVARGWVARNAGLPPPKTHAAAARPAGSARSTRPTRPAKEMARKAGPARPYAHPASPQHRGSSLMLVPVGILIMLICIHWIFRY